MLLSRMHGRICASSLSLCICFVAIYLVFLIHNKAWENSCVICCVGHLFCLLPFVFVFLLITMGGRIRASSVFSCFCVFVLFVAICFSTSVEQDAREDSRVICLGEPVCVCYHLFLCFCLAGCAGGSARHQFRRAFASCRSFLHFC